MSGLRSVQSGIRKIAPRDCPPPDRSLALILLSSRFGDSRESAFAPVDGRRTGTASSPRTLSRLFPGSRPIRIGLAGPFSDSVGAPMKRAAELAVEQINQAGGIGGRRIELVARDDYGDPDSAVGIATDLEAAGVVAVVGHVYSGTTLAAAPVYNGSRTPVLQISPSSSAPAVTDAGDYTFRTWPERPATGRRPRPFYGRPAGLQAGDDSLSQR